MGEKAVNDNQPRVSVTFVNAPTSWKKAQERLRKVGSHLGLILLLMVYTAGGAKVRGHTWGHRGAAPLNSAPSGAYRGI